MTKPKSMTVSDSLAEAFLDEDIRWSWYRDKVSGVCRVIRLTDAGLVSDKIEYQAEHEVILEITAADPNPVEAALSHTDNLRRKAAARAALKALADIAIHNSELDGEFGVVCRKLSEIDG